MGLVKTNVIKEREVYPKVVSPSLIAIRDGTPNPIRERGEEENPFFSWTVTVFFSALQTKG